MAVSSVLFRDIGGEALLIFVIYHFFLIIGLDQRESWQVPCVE